MNIPSHDFVTVDMRGMKAGLMARAFAERVSVSLLVRRAVAREFGSAVEGRPYLEDGPSNGTSSVATVKLSIRMTSEEAMRLAAGAKASGMSRGAYLAGVIAAVPVLTSGGTRAEHIATLTASSAELSTLSRNLHRLASLLRQGDVASAQPYREMLDTLAGDVSGHLKVAARVLADLQPHRRCGQPITRSSETQKGAA